MWMFIRRSLKGMPRVLLARIGLILVGNILVPTLISLFFYHGQNLIPVLLLATGLGLFVFILLLGTFVLMDWIMRDEDAPSH